MGCVGVEVPQCPEAVKQNMSKGKMAGKPRTYKMVSLPGQRHTPLELRMPQHLPTHTLLSHPFLVHAHLFRFWVHADNAWREALLKFCGEVWWDGLFGVEDYKGEKTVRCGCCVRKRLNI